MIPLYKVCNTCYYWLLGMDIVAECRSEYATITTRIPKRDLVLHADIKRMLKRYKSQYTVTKRILIDILRSYADHDIIRIYNVSVSGGIKSRYSTRI